MTTNSPNHDLQSITLSANGKQLAATVSGQGRPIVLFHSLLADQTSFDLILPALTQTHQVLTLTLPGFAGSDFVGSSLETIADHIAQALGTFDFSEKPILLGNGYGGFIALLTAIRHPDLASRLVLADCGAAFSEPGRAAFRGMSGAAREKGLGAIADVAMRRLFAPEYQALHPELIEARKQRFLAVDPQTFHGACEALATLDLRDRLQTVTLPVLILVGEQDEATPPPMSKELSAGLPNAKLTVLTGCAHVPQLQIPGEFMEAIGEFINQP
jgi:3-oxoadipate enol-lactonase